MSPPSKNSWLLRLSPEARALLLLRYRLDVSLTEARQLLTRHKRTHPSTVWAPNLASLVTFFGWMFAFGASHDALEPLVEDLPSWIAASMVLLADYGVAIALAMLAYIWLKARLLLRPIRRCIELPACLHCGYSLTGVPREGASVVCPECGDAFPGPPFSRD